MNGSRADDVIVFREAGSSAAIDLARQVIRESGSRSPIDFVGERPQEIQRTCPDLSKFRLELDWALVIPLDLGLRTIRWYRGVLSVPLVA
jgi:nucleoside-diphosphate-sugar epimerase